MHEIPATAFAFAAILGDGLVVTWGAAGSGGGCDSQGLHISKAQVHANRHAFFCLLGDGSVVAWGDAPWDSVVQDPLMKVPQI